MTVGPRLRQVLLAWHLVASVGWMGAVAAFAVLDITTAVSDDAASLRASYIAMALVTTWAILPLAFGALASGVVIGLATKWGLFRHYWVVMSLVLTAAATAVLLVQVPMIGHRADMATDPATTDAELRSMGNLLLHSIGGLVVLAVILVLNVVKPRGLTRHGWRKQQKEAAGDGGPLDSA